jgi:hypothetical protein
MKSSRSTSPGWITISARMTRTPELIIVDDLNLVGITIPPNETNPVLVVNPD